MKTLLFPLICAAAMAFTSCNDDEPIDCAAQYPFKVTKFIEKGGGTTIRFVPEESKLYYNYHIYTDSMVSDITVMLKYKYKIPYFVLEESKENMETANRLNLESIQVADTCGLNVTYRDGSVVYFHEYGKPIE